MVRGRYLIVQMIGYSQESEVYLAVDQGSGSAVALKRTVFGSDQAKGDALDREAKVLANLRHPVLPNVLDNFIEGSDHFLVVQHITGDDLAKRLEDSRKPFPLSWCMFWADQLLDALTYLHSHSPAIIHRAVSPYNMKLTDENHVVLLDYGSVRASDGAVALANPAVSRFASIEQIQGSALVPASDVYSLAASIYQLLANVMPIDAAVRAGALASGSADPHTPLSVVNDDVPIEISNVIHKGMEINIENRFGSAAEMQKALRRAYKQSLEAMTAETVAFSPGSAPTIPDATPVPRRSATQIYEEQDGIGSSFRGSGTAAQIQTDDDGPGAKTIENETYPPTEAYSDTGQSSGHAATIPSFDQATARIGDELKPEREMIPAAQIPVPPQAAAPVAAKKSSSKVLFVLGGLFVLVFLMVAAAGGGWYVYSNYYSGAQVDVTPAPTPDVPASPEPTVNVATDTNTNTNTEVGTSDDSNTTDDNTSQRTTTSPSTPPATRSTPQERVRDKPPRTTQTAAPKPTSKPKDDRTVILQ